MEAQTEWYKSFQSLKGLYFHPFTCIFIFHVYTSAIKTLSFTFTSNNLFILDLVQGDILLWTAFI